MKLLIKARQSGKTTQLIYTSEATGYPIVVPNYGMKKITEEMAAKMGCNIPEPITVGALRDKSHNGILDPDNVLLDNAEFILKDALKEYLGKNVVCATMSSD